MKLLRYICVFIFAFQSNAQISDFEYINFRKADSIALACKDEGLDNLSQLSQKLTSGLTTDAERFRAIYKWVCTNIANDYSLYLKNNRKRYKFNNDSEKLEAWNELIKKKIFYKLRKDKRTICTGYAYLIKELSNLANLNCEIVHGYGKTSTTNLERLDAPNHSWNAIELDGKWYLCDPTWASGIPNSETNEFKFYYNDGYFLTNPQLFAINHFPVNNKWMLLEEALAPSFETFLAAPIIYGKAYKNLTIHSEPKEMHNTIEKHDILTFKYQLQKAVAKEDISLLIDNGFSNRKIKPTSTHIENTSLTLEHQFDNNGFYDVHLYIGDDLISTYTVKVKS
ncbi:transglutaminase domain-containing protein [uncultured Psychroserpens sp.]|uniref:transglutaminase domain-containing protein n=1 Tax=uncultured Psychroserpens sp. TaxID=255436 RepID=UPI00260BA097|nr:transglutaminase domain-containing protein [uncultured Psychroserpens sp.]